MVQHDMRTGFFVFREEYTNKKKRRSYNNSATADGVAPIFPPKRFPRRSAILNTVFPSAHISS